MSGRRTLEWRPAEKGDRTSLAHFVCTEPEKPRVSAATRWKPEHPRHWEYEAQQTIRSLRPPIRVGCHLWVAYDGDGLAGVSSWEELEGPGIVHVDVFAIAMRHRRQRGRRRGALAREGMRATLGEIERRALEAGAPEMYAEAEIYRENDASLALTADFGFHFLREAPTGAQTWALRFPLTGIDLT